MDNFEEFYPQRTISPLAIGLNHQHRAFLKNDDTNFYSAPVRPATLSGMEAEIRQKVSHMMARSRQSLENFHIHLIFI